MEGRPSDEVRQVVLFALGDEVFGLPVERVTSIIRYESPTPVPHAPDYIEGVINMRGRIVPVVDLAHRLYGARVERTPGARIIVTETASGLVGFAVSSAHEVARIPFGSVMPAPDSVVSSDLSEAFEGVADHEGRLVILLVPDRLVPSVSFISADEAEGASVDA